MASNLATVVPREGREGRALLARVRSTLPEGFRGRLHRARDLRVERFEERPSCALPTCLDPLDGLLEGGLPRGRLVELVSRRTSGRFSTVLAALAAATGAGEAAALVDLGDALDPRVAEAAGVDLERLLWLRPRRLPEALAAAEMLLDGGFPAVVVDLGEPPVAGGRGNEASWLRLARLARARGAVLLVASPYRASGTGAATVLAARLVGAVWSGGGRRVPLLAGLGAELVREKHRGAAPGARGGVAFHTGSPWAEAVFAARAVEAPGVSPAVLSAPGAAGGGSPPPSGGGAGEPLAAAAGG